MGYLFFIVAITALFVVRRLVLRARRRREWCAFVANTRDEMKTAGAIALLDVHKHKCPGCGNVWEHDRFCAQGDADHTCSQCGRMQREKYFDDERPWLAHRVPLTEERFP